MATLIPETDNALADWVTNFVTVAAPDPIPLGLDDGVLDVITDLKQDLEQRIAAFETAQDAAKAATAAKIAANNALRDAVTFRVKMIQANRTIPDAKKAQLGIRLPAPRTNTPPVTVTELSVSGAATGVNTVAWNRGDNKATTVFQVQVKRAQTAPFVTVGTTTASRFLHRGQTPGRHLIYRVVSARANETSAPSEPGSVYADAAFPSHDNGITT